MKIILSLLLVTAGYPASAAEQIINWHKQDIYVIDGDTYKIKNKKYRLCGINTPEKGKRLYAEAGEALSILMKRSGDIKINVVDVGRYGREIVVMTSANYNKTINEIMVKGGYAKHYKRFSANCEPYIKVKNLEASERYAKKQKKGIWSK